MLDIRDFYICFLGTVKARFQRRQASESYRKPTIHRLLVCVEEHKLKNTLKMALIQHSRDIHSTFPIKKTIDVYQ